MGLATDGCSTMAGQKSSVATKFKEINPQVTHIKCICHSLQLCSSYAMKKLPDHLEYMVSETYRYFSHSSLRQQKYAKLYTTIIVGQQPLKILQLAETRWLAIAPCVTRVLDHYDELKLHFQVSRMASQQFPKYTRITTIATHTRAKLCNNEYTSVRGMQK